MNKPGETQHCSLSAHFDMGSREAPWSACGSSHRLPPEIHSGLVSMKGGGCCHTHSKVLRT